MKNLYLICLFIIPSILFGQGITVKKSISESNFPELYWQTNLKPDTSAFHVFRSDKTNNAFTEIQTIHFSKKNESSDTVDFVVIDTTLTEKALYFYQVRTSVNGKTVESEVAIGHNFGLLPKPQIAYFIANAATDRKAINLNWKLNFNQTVSSISLYRSDSYDTGYIKITDLSAQAETFTDVVSKSNEPWFYFMVIHDYFGDQVASVRTPAFATFAEKPFRPQNIIGKFNNDTITLSWKNTGHNIIGYHVYRSLESRPFKLINEMQGNIEKDAAFLDNSTELSSAKRVKYFVRNLSDGFVESSSSDTLSFYLAEHEAVLPPKVLDFTNNGGSIKLLWLAPDEGLLLGYNVYLSTPKDETKKINDDLITINYFTDSIYRSPGRYTYEVEGVGVGNKVSENRTTTVVYRYPPDIHVIIDLKKQKNGILISWKRPLNKNIKRLLLYKRYGQNKSVLKKSFPTTEDVSYLDTSTKRGVNYLYLLIAEMGNGEKITINNGVEMIW